MDEDLKWKLVGYLDAVGRAVQSGSDFVAVEVPDVARQWLLWLGIEAALYAAAALITAIVLYRLSVGASKSFDAVSDEQEKGFYAGGWLVTVSLSIMMLLLSASYAMRCAKIIIAPKVVIVEKVAELIKPVRGK